MIPILERGLTGRVGALSDWGVGSWETAEGAIPLKSVAYNLQHLGCHFNGVNIKTSSHQGRNGTIELEPGQAISWFKREDKACMSPTSLHQSIPGRASSDAGCRTTLYLAFILPRLGIRTSILQAGVRLLDQKKFKVGCKHKFRIGVCSL